MKYVNVIDNFSWGMATKPLILYLLPPNPKTLNSIFAPESNVLDELYNFCKDQKALITVRIGVILGRESNVISVDGVHFDTDQLDLIHSYFRNLFFNLLDI